jgi:hypothetical protein
VIVIILSIFLLTYTYIEAKANYHRGSILVLRYAVSCPPSVDANAIPPLQLSRAYCWVLLRTTPRWRQERRQYYCHWVPSHHTLSHRVGALVLGPGRSLATHIRKHFGLFVIYIAQHHRASSGVDDLFMIVSSLAVHISNSIFFIHYSPCCTRASGSEICSCFG